jgi:hypothetical protein
MQISNPEAEKVLVAGLLRDPIINIGLLQEKIGDMPGRLVTDAKTLVALQAVLAIFAKNPDALCDNAVLMNVGAPNVDAAKQIIALARSEQAINFEAVLEQCLMWSAIRATDDIQRLYSKWRNNGVSAEGYREIAAAMIDGIRKQFALADKRERLANEIFTAENTEPFSTGYKVFDEMLHGGWRPGEVNLIAGHTAGGKTVLQANICAWQVLGGNPALVVELEIGEQKFTDYVISVMTGIPYDRIDASRRKNGERVELTSDENNRIFEALEKLNRLMRLNTSAFTVPQISTWVAVHKEQFAAQGLHNILVEIDHLNMMKSADPKVATLGGMVMEAHVYAIHDMAHPEHGLGVPVTLTAQLEDASARIMMGKGQLTIEQYKVRSCRAIEHAVDSAWALGKSPKFPGQAVLQKIKDRNGDGSDNMPVGVPYCHPTRTFVR